MRANTETKMAVLVTSDPAVETAVRRAASQSGSALQHCQNDGDAMGMVFDAAANETVLIVDVEADCGSQRLVRTASGLLPVIAVGNGRAPWLASMVNHKKVCATLPKPVSAQALHEALERVRDWNPALWAT